MRLPEGKRLIGRTAQSELYGEFRYTSRFFTASIVVTALLPAWCVLGGISQCLEVVGGPTGFGPLLLVLSVPVAFPFTYCLLLRRNGLLRVSEDGIHYRDWRGRTTSLEWDHIVAFRPGSGRLKSWYVRYVCQAEGQERWVRLPPFEYLRAHGEPLKNTIRMKARLTRSVRSFWRGHGWERW